MNLGSMSKVKERRWRDRWRREGEGEKVKERR
jgi:hypothetical protein